MRKDKEKLIFLKLRFDEVAMLELNLRELQTEYKRGKEAQAEEESRKQRHTQYESFNITGSDSWENLPAAADSPGKPVGAVKEEPVVPAPVNSRLVAPLSARSSSFLPSPKALLTSLNPFGNGESEDEYDASGKNPFAE